AIEGTAQEKRAIVEIGVSRALGSEEKSSAQIEAGDRVGVAKIRSARCLSQIWNQRARPSRAAISRDGITAIDRAAVGETAFLKNSGDEIRVNRRTRDVRLGLRAHVRRQRRRIGAETNGI